MANEAEVPLVQNPAKDPEGVGLVIRKLAMIANSLMRKGQLVRTRDPLIKGDVWSIEGAGGGLTPGVYSNATVTVDADGAISDVTAGSGNSAWEHAFTKPVLADGTLVNDSLYTSSDDANGLFLWRTTPAGSDQVCLFNLNAALPTPTWSLVGRVQLIFLDDGNQYGGIHLYESGTGKIFTFGVIAGNEGSLRSILWTNVTTFNTNSKTVLCTLRHIWLRIDYDGTNYTPYWGLDGYSWVQFGAPVAKTTPFTTEADKVGFFSNAAGGNANGGVLCMSLECT